MQVVLAAVLIDALHAALEDAEIAFNGVRADDLLALVARIFLLAVVHSVMARNVCVELEVAIPRSFGCPLPAKGAVMTA